MEKPQVLLARRAEEAVGSLVTDGVAGRRGQPCSVLQQLPPLPVVRFKHPDRKAEAGTAASCLAMWPFTICCILATIMQSINKLVCSLGERGWGHTGGTPPPQAWGSGARCYHWGWPGHGPARCLITGLGSTSGCHSSCGSLPVWAQRTGKGAGWRHRQCGSPPSKVTPAQRPVERQVGRGGRAISITSLPIYK